MIQADHKTDSAEMRSIMKTSFQIQFSGREVAEKDMIAKVKEIWVASGNKIKDIQTLNIYCKPEEFTYYYVINDSFSGSVSM